MAKSTAAAAKSATEAAPATPATPNSPFAFETGHVIPEVRAVGRPGSDSPLMQAIKALPAPANGQHTSFFVPAAEVSASITDATEREKASADNVRKLKGSADGATRRVTKASGEKTRFAVRRDTKDGKPGIRVWRIADTTAAA